MPAKRTSQAIKALEDHMRSGHDIDQSAHVANTFALLSIAENLDALVEIGIDAIGGLKQIVRALESGRQHPAHPPRNPT